MRRKAGPVTDAGIHQRITIAGKVRRYRLEQYGELGMLVRAPGIEPFWARSTTEMRTVLRAAYRVLDEMNGRPRESETN